jgi:hypothetical protein
MGGDMVRIGGPVTGVDGEVTSPSVRGLNAYRSVSRNGCALDDLGGSAMNSPIESLTAATGVRWLNGR